MDINKKYSGGIGKERLTAFYTHHFVFSNPPDTSLSLVSRTVGIDRVIDESPTRPKSPG
jgi:carboxymethylenebutenolidase